MSVSDVIKKSFIENFSSADVKTMDVLFVLGMTVLLALYIFFVYRIITRKSFYNKNFNIGLPIIAVITAAIIMTIQSSIVVSLGMVGALSIVRFRTAVKDPLDLIFMFWAIAIGIMCGAGLQEIALVASAIITLLLWVLSLIPIAKVPLILVIQATYDKTIQAKIIQTVSSHTKFYKIKSKNISRNQLNIIIELRLKNDNTLLDEINQITNVDYVSLIDHDGETTF